ncbi:hypothetical protein ES705_17561 [subsurface metagenome]
MNKEVSTKVQKYPSFELSKKGDKIEIHGTSKQFDNVLELFKTDSMDVMMEKMDALVTADYREDVDQVSKTTAALGKLTDLAPQDAIEVTLCCQMIILEQQFVYMTRGANNTKVNTGEAVLTARSHAMRLSREYLNHVDTLRKYRTGGEQIIKHVHINEGGQAVVFDNYVQGGQKNGN